ncbi:MAG: glycosyltransferase family 4 protein [Acidobacteriota bacterium]|nr:glycosyltransferase family 4 protein [Acidobacteriota bacterium]
MRVYAEQLRSGLAPATDPGDRVDAMSLADARLQPPGRYWDQYVRYQRLAGRVQSDVHHILDHGFAHLAGAMPKGRVVVTFHDATPVRLGIASFGTRRMLEIGMRSAAAKGAHFITGSEASSRDAQEFFAVDPAVITIVPYGVDERFRPPVDRDGLRASLGLSRPTVLIVGHTQPYMNVEGALAAAARAAAHVDLEVVKIGAPLTVEHGRLAVSLGLRIRETGIVADAAMADWYGAADALLYLPTLSGFGLPAIEAMASGMPVVTSSTGGVLEVARGAAALVDPRDVAAAGDALASVLTDGPRRHALIDQGIARAAEFSWRRTAQETLRVYRAVAHGA